MLPESSRACAPALHENLFSLALSALLLAPLPSHGISFVDVTDDAGLALAAHGYTTGLTSEKRMVTSGVAAGDYDGDGWVDLYSVRGDAGSNQLFRNLGDGTFVDVAAAAGVAITGEFGSGPTFADYDGDGWLDLFVGGIEGTSPRLFRNLGDGTFEEKTGTCGIVIDEETFSAAFGDFDRDGDLDLITTHWLNLPTGNTLWRNEGDGTFSNVDEAVGIVGFEDEFTLVDYTFTANFADIDNDRWPDVILTSDFGSSHVFRNDMGTFTKTTGAVITDENGMGAAIADYDNDGDLDWFVSSIWDTTGGSPPWGITGNRLYRNYGDGTFEDVTDDAGVRGGYWGWGSSFADFNNDGHLDLFHVNGWYQPDFDDDPARLFIANGDGSFVEAAAATGIADPGQGRGVVCFDFDRDGDLDLFIANNSSKHALYRNDGGNSGNWLTAKLVEAGPNTEAIGARVYLTIGGTTQMREIRAGCNFVSQDPTEAHFGLGTASVADELRVEWTNGDSVVLTDVAANQYLVLDQTVTGVSVLHPPSSAGPLVLYGSFPNPFESRTAIRFQLERDLSVRLRVFDTAGRRVRTLAEGPRPRGDHTVSWDGRDGDEKLVSPGVYFYSLEGGAHRVGGKLVLRR